MNTETHYYINQVATITGLSKQVIRKWEDRYNVVSPTRLDNGYRVYRQADINCLLQVKELKADGLTTGKAINEIKKIYKANKNNESDYNNYTMQLLEHGKYYKEVQMSQVLKQAYYFYGLELMIEEVIRPFLKEIGNRWESGEWSESQETVSSMVIRDFLIQVRRNLPTLENAPLVIGACLPEERHELPLHINLLPLTLKGCRTLLLGPSPAPGTIERLTESLQPKTVLLSATTDIPFKTKPGLLKHWDEFAKSHPQTNFYMGGKGAIEYTDQHPPSFIKVTNDLKDIKV
ncbi:MerR family transcriptional regulator [Virgibacillus halodenitrificans]|uniref:MerR family transcriptional regulator n=1 Tax=Virgibacillus halodenitrificans TaxID=1482 RepID=UPI001F2B7A45|nr:MerR family transcriptional regulator [Virgibacillus halodenitrificans]